ncbi:MAG: sigma-70 family RNA polymerase sigma factor [Weeksellaceae bacterium]
MGKELKILIKECQRNKRDAQEEVYKRFSDKLFSVCLRYTKNYEDAQDIFQDGFILIFKKIGQYEFKGSFEGWMRRIMVNLCIEKFRNTNYLYVVNEEITADEEVADELIEDENEFSYEELLGFVRQLPARYGQIFNMYVIDGYSHKQISDLLNISVGTSKSNLSRAREKLIHLINKKSTEKIVSK